MSSFRYHLVRTLARVLGHRNVYRMDTARLAAWLEKNRDRRKTGMPAWIKQKYAVCTETVMGRPVHVMAPADAGSGGGPALLFLHGGGFIMEAHAVHWRAAARMVDALGITVWFPAYPLVSGRPAGDRVHYPSMRDINEMIRSVYRYMLDVHKDGRIVFFGDSAGAALALVFCHHNRAMGLPQPMPGHLVLVSPAQPVETDGETREAMQKIENSKKDALLSLVYMKSLSELLGLDSAPENYFSAPLYGDFGGFPAMDLYAGTDDVSWPQAEAFAERARRSGGEIRFHRGEGMMHVWPLMPAAPECREAFDEITAITGAALGLPGYDA